MNIKPLILRDGGYHAIHPVYRRDLAQSYLLALASINASNQVYNIAQTKSFRLVDWIELSADCLEVQSNIVNIPADVMQQASITYAEPATNRLATVDTSKARADLGFQSTPVESWTALTAQWYRDTRHEYESAGYSEREKEVEFAQRYMEKIGRLKQ